MCSTLIDQIFPFVVDLTEAQPHNIVQLSGEIQKLNCDWQILEGQGQFCIVGNGEVELKKRFLFFSFLAEISSKPVTLKR